MEIRLPDARYTCPIPPFGENSLLTFLTVVSVIGVSPHRRAPPVLTKHELGVTRAGNEAAQRADPVEPESIATPLFVWRASRLVFGLGLFCGGARRLGKAVSPAPGGIPRVTTPP